MKPILSKPLSAGATIGVVGGGQLGRMLAMAAKRLGYRFHVYAEGAQSPAGQVSDAEWVGRYDDADAIRAFAAQCQVLTYEFENVSSETLHAVGVPVFPSPEVLFTTQNRAREKKFLAAHGFPVADFQVVASTEELQRAVAALGLPAILKTAGFGYDGKGQSRLTSEEDVRQAVSAFGSQVYVLERLVEFEKEVSVVAARAQDGTFSHWGVIENIHQNHILDISFVPANVSTSLSAQAIELTAKIFSELSIVGVACVEFFVAKNGALLVNEIAPRVHNSGHLTIEASPTSQFEQHIRAICGIPLGETTVRPAAMANLLGDLWVRGEPSWEVLRETPGAILHLYGKAQAAKGKKMGHITALGENSSEAVNVVKRARGLLE